MTAKKKIIFFILAGTALLIAVFCLLYGAYRRPYRATVRQSGVSEALVFSVMKAESGFRENATSRAGAVGIMQILPSTAQFICEREGMEFIPDKMLEGAYNAEIGCKYLKYLLEKFECKETAIAAYNAGEGTVLSWLSENAYSDDGVRLNHIPYPETKNYVNKVMRYEKRYMLLYGKNIKKF